MNLGAVKQLFCARIFFASSETIARLQLIFSIEHQESSAYSHNNSSLIHVSYCPLNALSYTAATVLKKTADARADITHQPRPPEGRYTSQNLRLLSTGSTGL
jgi:hypothetical protein